MKTKTIRVPEELMSALEIVRDEEKIEESTAMRKLLRMGFETYVGNLYKQGKITLREAAKDLKVSQIDVMNIFIEAGIKGNLEASDVLISIEKFGVPAKTQ